MALHVLLVDDDVLDSLGGLGDLPLDTLLSLVGLLLNLLGGGRGLAGLVLISLVLGLGVGVNAVAAVLGDELGEVLNSARAAVLNGLVLLASGEQLDGGEALDLIGNVVGGSVDLGDGNLGGVVGVLGEEGGELIVLGRETAKRLAHMYLKRGRLGNIRLAVTAPGSVELEQDILVVVNDLGLVGVGNDDGDRALLLLGNGLGLDAGLDLSTKVVLNVLGDGLLGDLLLLVEGELLVLGRVLDGEGGPLADLEVEVGTVLTESLSVNSGEVDDTLLLFGNGLQGLGEFLALLGSLSEDVGEGNASL